MARQRPEGVSDEMPVGVKASRWRSVLSAMLTVLVGAGTVAAQPPQPGASPAASANQPTAVAAAATVADDPLRTLQDTLTVRLQQQFAAFPVIDEASGNAVMQYSGRGDLRMFLGQFPEAVSDYQQMVRLQPAIDVSHWRLGIALFFAGRHQEAAQQFDKYHAFDQVDRENGIWRYLSHYRAYGAEQARKELLRYEKDDRPPFPEVYRLFEGTLTREQVLSAIPADLSEDARRSRLFYSDLYIGFHEMVQGKNDVACRHLGEAVRNQWPRTAGYGPDYMWHVGRLQYFLLTDKSTPERPAVPPAASKK